MSWNGLSEKSPWADCFHTLRVPADPPPPPPSEEDSAQKMYFTQHGAFNCFTLLPQLCGADAAWRSLELASPWKRSVCDVHSPFCCLGVCLCVYACACVCVVCVGSSRRENPRSSQTPLSPFTSSSNRRGNMSAPGEEP